MQCCRLLCEVQTPVFLKWTEIGEQLAVGTRQTPASNKHSCHVDSSLPLGCKRTMNNFFTATGFSTLPTKSHTFWYWKNTLWLPFGVEQSKINHRSKTSFLFSFYWSELIQTYSAILLVHFVCAKIASLPARSNLSAPLDPGTTNASHILVKREWWDGNYQTNPQHSPFHPCMHTFRINVTYSSVHQ